MTRAATVLQLRGARSLQRNASRLGVVRQLGGAMKLFYGWVIVGVGMVVSCIGMGAICRSGVFLQPISEAMGWSRTGHLDRRAAQLPCDGLRRVPLGRAVRPVRDARGRAVRQRAARPRPGPASQAASLGQFQLLVRPARRPRPRAASSRRDGHDDPLVHPEPQPGRGAGLGRHQRRRRCSWRRSRAG